jgi:hypothetical protein
MSETLGQYLPLILPLVLIQLVLMLVALWDIAHRDKVRGPKWLWVILIILGEMIGPVAYLLVGRQDE